MKRALLATVLSAVSTALVGPGCNTDVDSRLALAELGRTCRINSDCAEQLVCVFERCHQECSTSRDCEGGARCMQSEQTLNACQLPDEQACSEHGSCPGQQVCGVDAECRDGCSSDDDCVTEQVCSAGTCADTSELGPEGLLAPKPERPTAGSLPCQLDSDCPAALVCSAGSCKAECETSRDCAAGQSCREGVCESAEAPLAECLRNSDCAVEQHCVNGSCQLMPESPTPDCSYDSDCPRDGQHCSLGQCLCECVTDTDCSKDAACTDGCACEPGRVLRGDMTISDGAQLGQLDNVREIEGRLTLKLRSSGTFHLPGLKKVKDVRVQFVSNVEPIVVFDALESVTGEFACEQTCAAPRLVWAGSVTSDAPTARELSLPALVSTDKINVWRNTRMTSVRFANLTTATIFNVSGSPRVTSLFVPRLSNVEAFTVSNVAMDALAFPVLVPSKSAVIKNCSRLQQLDLSGVWAEPPEGGQPPGPLTLSLGYLPQLTTLKLDQQRQLAALSVDNTGLTNLEPFAFDALTGSSSLTFTSNPALPTCDVTDLKTDLEAQGWGGAFSHSGNLEGACP